MLPMRKELVFLGALLLFVILLASAVKVFEVRGEQGDARTHVLSDLRSKYPGADSDVINMEERQNANGQKYFYIKARVTIGSASACPERMHVYYNYPEQNFETEPLEHVTSSCQVCLQRPCVLAFPEEATIASHTLEGGEPVARFLDLYPSAYPVVEETAIGWRVTWDAPLSTYVYKVDVNREGRLVDVKKVEKEL